MIDLFTWLLIHGLLFIAFTRLMMDDTIDEDPVLKAIEDADKEQGRNR